MARTINQTEASLVYHVDRASRHLNRPLKLPEHLLGRVKPDQPTTRIVEIQHHVDRQRNGSRIDHTMKHMAGSGFRCSSSLSIQDIRIRWWSVPYLPLHL